MSIGQRPKPSRQRNDRPAACPRPRTLVLGGSGCALAVALFGVGGAAHAQDNGAQAPQNLEEITVTGSRIRRTTDFDTSNPTTVVDEAYMRNLGIVNVGEAIAQLPSNVSSFRPETTGNS